MLHILIWFLLVFVFFFTKLYGMKEYRTKLLIFQHQLLSVLCYSFNSKEGTYFSDCQNYYIPFGFWVFIHCFSVYQDFITFVRKLPRLSIGWMPFLSTSIISGIFPTFVFLSRIIIFLSYAYLPLDYIIWIQIWPFLLIAVIFRAWSYILYILINKWV